MFLPLRSFVSVFRALSCGTARICCRYIVPDRSRVDILGSAYHRDRHTNHSRGEIKIDFAYQQQVPLPPLGGRTATPRPHLCSTSADNPPRPFRNKFQACVHSSQINNFTITHFLSHFTHVVRGHTAKDVGTATQHTPPVPSTGATEHAAQRAAPLRAREPATRSVDDSPARAQLGALPLPPVACQ